MEVDALRVGLLSGQNPVACISKRDLVSRRAEHDADKARAPACALDLDFDHASEMARADSAARKGDEPTWEVRRLVYAQEKSRSSSVNLFRTAAQGKS